MAWHVWFNWRPADLTRRCLAGTGRHAGHAVPYPTLRLPHAVALLSLYLPPWLLPLLPFSPWSPPGTCGLATWARGRPGRCSRPSLSGEAAHMLAFCLAVLLPTPCMSQSMAVSATQPARVPALPMRCLAPHPTEHLRSLSGFSSVQLWHRGRCGDLPRPHVRVCQLPGH